MNLISHITYLINKIKKNIKLDNEYYIELLDKEKKKEKRNNEK